jgi:hypothetical protein
MSAPEMQVSSTQQGSGTGLEARERERVAYLMERGAIFVFGSNHKGAHGRGAAALASKKYGARWGKGEGLYGRCYALPTKDRWIRTLPLDIIRVHVERFIGYATVCDDLTFAVTRIGCGLAGYTDADIAPMFADAPDNCDLPESWRTTPTPDEP